MTCAGAAVKEGEQEVGRGHCSTLVLMADGMEPVLAAEKQLGVLASRSSRSALRRPLSVGFRREARRAGRPQREKGGSSGLKRSERQQGYGSLSCDHVCGVGVVTI